MGAALCQLAAATNWRPVEIGELHRPMAPLLLDNLRRSGCEPSRFLAAVIDLPDPQGPTIRYHFVLKSFLSLMDASLFERFLLIKGSALAGFYSNAAHRPRCDIDALVAEDDAPHAAEALLDAGWKIHSGTDNVYQHRAGVLLDLQPARTEFAKALLESGIPHSEHPADWPKPGWHLALTAIHTILHHGEKVWRDRADAMLLLAHPEFSHDDFSQACCVAERSGYGQHIRAFLWFLHRSASGYPLLRDLPPGEPNAIAKMLLSASVESAPERSLHLLRRLTAGVSSTRLAKKSANSGPETGARRHLGSMSRGERVAFAGKELWRLAGEGSLPRLLRLARVQNRFAKWEKRFL